MSSSFPKRVGIVPLNWLSFKVIVTTSVKRPSPAGMAPLSLLESRFKILRFWRWVIVSGIEPTSLFFRITSSCNRKSLSNMFGMVPLNSLLSMCRLSMFSKVCSEVMGPENRLLLILTSRRLLRLPTASGRVPSKLLLSRKVPVMWDIFARSGKDPVSLLWETAKYLSLACFDQVDGIGPTNWLCAALNWWSSVSPPYSTGSVPTRLLFRTNNPRSLESFPREVGRVWSSLLLSRSRLRRSAKAVPTSSGMVPSKLLSSSEIPVTRALSSYFRVKGIQLFSSVAVCSRETHSTPCQLQIPFSVIQPSEFLHPPPMADFSALLLT
mmetsp:Transcript_20423/g.42645  ORF Transcript_20423/g.42645 Transcript_20423/m.42645 type:complete len:324 (+) Transcript_20423:2182-3153(+)